MDNLPSLSFVWKFVILFLIIFGTAYGSISLAILPLKNDVEQMRIRLNRIEYEVKMIHANVSYTREDIAKRTLIRDCKNFP